LILFLLHHQGTSKLLIEIHLFLFYQLCSPNNKDNAPPPPS
jgi:hypothetical protein